MVNYEQTGRTRTLVHYEQTGRTRRLVHYEQTGGTRTLVHYEQAVRCSGIGPCREGPSDETVGPSPHPL